MRALRRFRGLLLSLLALALVGLAAPPALAQTCPVGQHCFYVPPLMPSPPTYEQQSGWDLVLSSPEGTITGTIAFGDAAPQAFSATSGQPLKVPLSPQLGVASGYDTIERRGVFIAADRGDLGVVQRFVDGPWNSSATIKEANSALGTRFRAGGYVLEGFNTVDTGHDIVSLYAPFGASVTIDPPGDAQDFWDDGFVGNARTVVLAAGQTVILRTRNVDLCGYDLTGALITSDDPVSVITGGRGWAVSGACDPNATSTCGDDGVDHLIPEAGLGTRYVVDRYPGFLAERVSVVATVDGTVITVAGQPVGTFAAGAFHRFVNAGNGGPTLIEASHPVYVFQDAGLQGCEAGLSIIPPIAFLPDTALGVDFDVNGQGLAAVLIATDDAPTVTLNGQAPVGAATAAVPGAPELSRVRFNVPGGSNRVAAASDFQLGLVTAAPGTGLFAYYNPFRVPGCGDGVLDPGEACDPGIPGFEDSCSAQCRIEVGFPGCVLDEDCVPAGFCREGMCAARCFGDGDCDDGDPCTTNLCDLEGGGCQSMPAPSGTVCGLDGVCDGAGACVGCVPGAGEGPDPGCSFGAPHCVAGDDGPRCVECLADEACWGHECATGVCDDGACGLAPVAAGEPCWDIGYCDGDGDCLECLPSEGAVDLGCDEEHPLCVVAGPPEFEGPFAFCVACLVDADCDDSDPCTANTCVEGACDAVLMPTGGTDTTCDGIDDNCSGVADDGYEPQEVSCPQCQGAPMTSCVGGVEIVPACQPVADGEPCDGGFCVLAAECSAGSCAPLLIRSCDDGNPCTVDACDNVLGACVASPLPNFTACDDGDLCTTDGVCVHAACASVDVICGPPGACELPGTCNAATGVCDYPFVPGCVVCDEDFTPPILTCPAPVSGVECALGGAEAPLGEASAQDVCSPVTVTDDRPPRFELGVTHVTFRAVDEAGNDASCVTTVEVVDTEQPTVYCPERTVVEGDPGICGALVALGVTADDACDGAAVEVLNADEAFFPAGETAVTVVAVDRSGNQAVCQAVVEVTGLDAFTIECEEELSVAAAPDLCVYPDNLWATAVDACGLSVDVSSANDGFPVGETVVTFTATRERDGATATCQTRLEVVDETPPMVLCAGSPEEPRPLTTTLVPRASDACGVDLVIASAGCVRTVGGVSEAVAERCDVTIEGEVVVVRDAPPSLGGDVAVVYTVVATDPSGNVTERECVAAVDPESLHPGEGDPFEHIIAQGGGCAGAPMSAPAAWALLLLVALALRRRRAARPSLTM